MERHRDARFTDVNYFVWWDVRFPYRLRSGGRIGSEWGERNGKALKGTEIKRKERKGPESKKKKEKGRLGKARKGNPRHGGARFMKMCDFFRKVRTFPAI